MTHSRRTWATTLAVLALATLVGCEQENPVEKAGKDVSEHAQRALDKAKQVGGALEGAAERAAKQMKDAAK